MATGYLKDLDERKRVCLELASELRGWRYLLNEEGALAMQKPEGHSFPILRSQTYINATNKAIADFLTLASNFHLWDPCCTHCETEDQQPKAGITLILRHARYSLGPEPELQRTASYVLLRASYKEDIGKGGICIIGFSQAETEQTAELPIEFVHFSFVLEAQGPLTAPCTKVTFLWQVKTEGNLSPEHRAALFRTVGKCTSRLKAAIEA